MFILLSSGAKPRYRQDVLRAIAMPKGMQLPFRYSQDIIEQNILAKIELGLVKDQEALICYIDQHEPSLTPEVIPCRYARITDAQIYGSTVTINLSLGDFVKFNSVQTFNNELRNSATELPNWQCEGGQFPVGKYWLETAFDLNISKSKEIGDWEKTINELSRRADFKGEPCFYIVTGLHLDNEGTALIYKNCGFDLSPRQKYEIRIYHYNPERVAGISLLRFSSASTEITFITNPLLTIDSPYDLKKVRFKTGEPNVTEETFLSLYRGSTIMSVSSGIPGNILTGISEFDIPLRVNATP